MIEPYYLVSGAHRSGTSMMMRMLEAAGCPVDYNPKADRDLINEADLLDPGYEPNPNGFYERGVMQPGVAVKRVAMNLVGLMVSGKVRMIFMRRPEAERRMSLQRWKRFNGWHMTHRLKTDDLLRAFCSRNDVEVANVNYHDTLADPAATLADLESMGWPIKDIEAGAKIPDPNLWRHRVNQ